MGNVMKMWVSYNLRITPTKINFNTF